MKTKSIEMVWLVVKDLKKAVQFYTETVGLKLDNISEEYGWAELHGEDGGAKLGIAQENDKYPSPIKPGQNSCVTLTVENLDRALKHLQINKAKCLGPVQEVPGHVKMQTVADVDGNIFQLVEKLG